MIAPPLAIMLSIVGLFRDDAKGSAVAGLLIGGTTSCLYLLPMLIF